MRYFCGVVCEMNGVDSKRNSLILEFQYELIYLHFSRAADFGC